MLRPVLAVSAFSATLLYRADVLACVCAGAGFSVPASGATDVPRNLGTIMLSDASPVAAYALRVKADQRNVPLGAVHYHQENVRLLVAELANSLEPETSYELVETQHGASVVRLEFMTGLGEDLSPPDPATIEGLSIEQVDASGSTCMLTDGHRVNGSLSIPDGAAVIGVRFAAGVGGGQARFLPPERWALGLLGTGTCDIQVRLTGGTEYQLEVWAQDVAGNASSPSTYVVVAPADGCSVSQSRTTIVWTLVLLAIAYRARRARSTETCG